MEIVNCLRRLVGLGERPQVQASLKQNVYSPPRNFELLDIEAARQSLKNQTSYARAAMCQGNLHSYDEIN